MERLFYEGLPNGQNTEYCNNHFTWYVMPYCLSNALHSSIGQNIKSLACPLSGLSVKNFKWP